MDTALLRMAEEKVITEIKIEELTEMLQARDDQIEQLKAAQQAKTEENLKQAQRIQELEETIELLR